MPEKEIQFAYQLNLGVTNRSGQKGRITMNSVSGESHTPNHVMQTSPGRPSPSRVEIAVRVVGLVLAGLTSIPMIAHAASINVPCQLAQLINAISGAVNGMSCPSPTVASTFFPLPMTQTSFLATMGFRSSTNV